ncbi:RNA 2',3'-cyclic phosphodiesterase [Alteraurantiacibacter aquimixticola]|uniref:RNA 2',3'-cyclic phosphodiesterase n=1 Tax=Alteraurantiacibacter aquimixticola TaxID=2489173 RepID=A0A4T3F271_9SPHN|nr:RNA 2',3'-cyclic phosphodiesterase [Alteraurantiacibacter aquimixticola]TIX50395.1 RNA 2',3'-cyclic phosphodiesterase [Alteraurantiacibacter aquimixticola]
MPRLFTAIRPPAPVMDALIDTMEAVENARWQDEEQLHVTLTFMGDVAEAALGDVVDALSRVSFDPFELTIAGVRHFERKGLVHSIWAGIEPSPELVALQRQVDRACRALGLDIETRKYLPHITLARFSRHSADIPAWLAQHAKLRCGPFTVEDFALFESHLSSGPAHYEEVARFSC